MSKVSRDVARAVRRSAAAAGIEAMVAVTVERDWASALFEGARVTLEISAGKTPLDDWLAALPEADLPLGGHFVASAEVMDRPPGGAAMVEILAIADS